MTSPTIKWVPRLCVTDMWAQVNGQHLTGQRSTQVGSKLGQFGSGWAGLGRAGSDTWQAMVLPRRSRGLLLGLVHKLGLRWTRALVHGGPRLLPVNRVRPSPLSLCGPRAPGACVSGWRGEASASISGVFPPVLCSPMWSYDGAVIQLRWGKASPGDGEPDGGVWVAIEAP
jgi:hypothetical protein